MGYEVSRRSFLKGAAALAVATAASGLLTACGGGKGDGCTIGEYTVYLSLQSYGWMNEKKNPYGFVIPEVKIKGKKSGFNNKSYKEMFALKVGDVEFKLDENKRVTLIRAKRLTVCRNLPLPTRPHTMQPFPARKHWSSALRCPARLRLLWLI